MICGRRLLSSDRLKIRHHLFVGVGDESQYYRSDFLKTTSAQCRPKWFSLQIEGSVNKQQAGFSNEKAVQTNSLKILFFFSFQRGYSKSPRAIEKVSYGFTAIH